MNGDAALDLIMARLGGRSNATLRANALIEMQLAQDFFTQKMPFMPWFLQIDYTDAAFLTVAAQEYVALPSDFLRLDDDWGALYYKNEERAEVDQWQAIRKSTYSLFKDKYFDGESQDPSLFDIVGQRLYMRPIPASARELRMLYYKKDTSPTDTAATNLWLTYAPNWLIGEAGSVIAGLHVKDMEAAEFFAVLAKQAKDFLATETVARRVTGQSYAMGDS
jgi:hypothetical protein